MLLEKKFSNCWRLKKLMNGKQFPFYLTYEILFITMEFIRVKTFHQLYTKKKIMNSLKMSFIIMLIIIHFL